MELAFSGCLVWLIGSVLLIVGVLVSSRWRHPFLPQSLFFRLSMVILFTSLVALVCYLLLGMLSFGLHSDDDALGGWFLVFVT